LKLSMSGDYYQIPLMKKLGCENNLVLG
jgi:hypothetical protein